MVMPLARDKLKILNQISPCINYPTCGWLATHTNRTGIMRCGGLLHGSNSGDEIVVWWGGGGGGWKRELKKVRVGDRE